ncbi:MAG: hypothetical protein PVG39_29495 [Desulfobacteraceae bacterium]|jgi:predicted nucleic acid-binding protein
MQNIVSNATPLIYLAKADQLILLHEMFETIFIPDAVYREVVIQGKNKGETDAFRVERAVKDGWIVVKKIKKICNIELSMHPGEVEVISLALELAIKVVLMDDTKARITAELAGLRPKGTLWLLLNAVKGKILDFDRFLIVLEDIVKSGFYLKEEVFLKAVHQAKTLSEK